MAESSPQNTDRQPDSALCRISPEAEARTVRELFSRIAGGYDFLNRLLSFGTDIWWRRCLVRRVEPFPPQGSGILLDMAAGTMDVSVALAKKYPHRQVLALDFCLPMLRTGRGKIDRLARARTAPVRIWPLVGDGRCLPLPDACVDAVTIAFGLRNIRPREAAYAEVLRVLRPGGRFCVLEFGSAQDRILFGIYNFYLTFVLPGIGRLFSRDQGAYRYLADTISLYPAATTLAAEMEQAGFCRVEYWRLSAGIVCLHTGVKPLP